MEAVTLDVLRLNNTVVASCRSAALYDAVELKMGIEMVLKGLIAHEPHAADRTLEFDAFEEFGLR